MEKLFNMRNSKFLFGILIAAYWVACSPKNFSKDPTVDQCQNSSQNCVTNNGRDYFDYNASANGGLVDILFVDDNSGSMSFEQANMAARFGSFLSQLDARFIDYRIGIITSDVSTEATSGKYPDNQNYWSKNNTRRAINQNGALQDGNLIQISGAGAYITSSMSNREQMFANAIRRNETTACETYLRQYPNSPPPSQGIIDNCPSGDERGIFAANLFFDKNPSSFIRPNAHLAIVFLADEDVRSQLYTQSTAYALSDYDLGSTLLNKINSSYSGKTASFHAIIAKDQQCVNTQSSQMGPNGTYGITYNQMLGTYGSEYNKARALTNGILGDICANDYGSQLSTISANIVDRLADISLACENPSDLVVTLTPPLNTITWSVSGKTLSFSQPLPPGTSVNLKYSCPSL